MIRVDECDELDVCRVILCSNDSTLCIYPPRINRPNRPTTLSNSLD